MVGRGAVAEGGTLRSAGGAQPLRIACTCRGGASRGPTWANVSVLIDAREYSAATSHLLPGAAASVQALDETSMRVGAYVPPAGDAPAPAPDPREHASRLSPH